MNKQIFLATVIFASAVIVTGSAAFISMQGQGSKGQPTGADKLRAKAEAESKVPIAQYSKNDVTDPHERSKRDAKNHRFPKGRLDDLPGVTETEIVDGTGIETRSALPIAASDMVIIGNVLDARAYLSTDLTGLFSEFKVAIERLFKVPDGFNAFVGTNVVVEREGGRIRYPSGRTRWIRFAHEGMPAAGERYVFFLKQSSTPGTFLIVTAYELKNGTVIPLDGVSDFENKLPQFASYEGMAEDEFVRTVAGKSQENAR